jgi:hypothetical protein
MTPPIIVRELDSPDPVGSALTRYRGRVYRFSNDPRHYVLAECLEERFLDDRPLQTATTGYVHACLTRIRETGRVPDFDPAIAAAENIDIEAEIADRRSHDYFRVLPGRPPDVALVIVGAPRSGTSHLVNLLARTGLFAYFTTASCWAWPTRNLAHPRRRLLTEVDDAVLRVDNKRTRMIPALVMPGEAEDVYHRALPVYQHIAGHRYRLQTPRTGHIDILRAAVSAHTELFKRRAFLTKSPFHSFRIRHLDELWGPATAYVHIVRDKQDTADSMRRNNFEYVYNGQLLTAEDAWTLFVAAIERDAPAQRTLTVTHTDLINQPSETTARILDWNRPSTP